MENVQLQRLKHPFHSKGLKCNNFLFIKNERIFQFHAFCLVVLIGLLVFRCVFLFVCFSLLFLGKMAF